jgi:hypothetical protein
MLHKWRSLLPHNLLPLSEPRPFVYMDLMGLKNKAASEAYARAMVFSDYFARASKKVVLWALAHGEETKVVDSAAAPTLLPSSVVYLIGFLLALNLVMSGFLLWEHCGLDIVKYLQGCTSTSECI